MADIIETKDEVITENETASEQVEEKTYTMEEIKQMMERNLAKELAKQKKSYEKQLSLSKLDGDERAKAEKDQEIAELKEQLAAFQIERNKSELKSVLSSRGLSAEFADIINISDDIEASQANIDKLDKLFKAAVRAEVEKRLAGNTPKGNGSSAAAEITKESVKNMSMTELNQLAKTQPEVFARLFD